MYAAALFAVGLLLWGQGNLWNADYGVLAGQDLDLAANAWRAPYELAGWAAALLASLVFFRPISRLAPFASLVFLGVQTAAIAASGGESDAAQRARWVEPPAAIYQFSATQNVIHVVLDEFQADVFDDIFQQDRAALDRQFAGFQYFSDHAGSFPTTSFSMPAMLAGQEYRNQKPAPEFVREAFKQSSVFEKVSKAGYDVDATSIVPTDSFEQWLGPEAAPNWKGARFRIRKPFVSREDYREVSARQLLELSLFRHVPHAAKAISVDRPDSFYWPIAMDRTESPAQVRRHEASNSAAFLEQFIGLMSVGARSPGLQAAARRRAAPPHRRRSRMPLHRPHGHVERELHRAIQVRHQARGGAARSCARARHLRQQPHHRVFRSRHRFPAAGFRGRSESLSLIPGPSTVRLPDDCLHREGGHADQAAQPDRPRYDLGRANLSCRSAFDDPRHPRPPGRFAGRTDVRARPPSTPHEAVRHVQPAREWRFPKAFLDRLDVLTIDGRVLDAASWNVKRLIWRPDLRLEEREVDLGPRGGNPYAGPGWSLERREADGDSQQIDLCAGAHQPRHHLAASLPTAAAELVLRASSRWAQDRKRCTSMSMAGPSRHSIPQPVTATETSSLPFRPIRRGRRSAISRCVSTAGDRPDFVFKLDRLTIR